MYVMSYWDHDVFQNFAVSESKEALENLRDEKMKYVRKYKAEQELWQKEVEKKQQKVKTELREFLERNIDSLREIRPRYFDGNECVPDFHEEVGVPYAPEKKAEEQGKALDVIVSSYWHLFIRKTDLSKKRIAEFLDLSKLTEPLPVIECDLSDITMPRAIGVLYDETCFRIEEIEQV